ncbi:hypothetical protein HMPREF1861_00755 [Corynebacterium kroppenstedtii]|nr:hypothetical protein HMPREF1861_00755 [Corynebacterium kroppenstedtii]
MSIEPCLPIRLHYQRVRTGCRPYVPLLFELTSDTGHTSALIAHLSSLGLSPLVIPIDDD